LKSSDSLTFLLLAMSFVGVEDERKARQISSIRQEKQRTKQLAQTSRITLDDLYQRITAGEVKI
jgi:translation initiation factor IF-2